MGAGMRRLRQDQKDAIRFLYERDTALLCADIGTGKTVIALTVLQLWARNLNAGRAIVFAPSRVCTDVWSQEVGEWPHLGLSVQSAAGRPEKARREILEGGADVVCINYENIPWLMRTYPEGVPGFGTLWFDEVDKMKSPTSLRFKGRGRKNSKSWKQGMRHWREHFARTVGMTGTPVSNGLLDLWAQVYCADGPERFGDYERYKRSYFYQSDWSGYKWRVYPESVPRIHDKIADLTFRIEAPVDMAPVVYTPPRYVDLPPCVRKQYKEMERHYVMEFDTGDPAVAINAATAYSKLRQAVAGFVYGEGETRFLHDAKLAELDSLISELNGAQLMIVYHFKEQAEQLRRRYGARIAFLTYKGDTIKRWNDGELPLLGLQPQSGGHGLNLQHSGAHHVCMLTEPESAGLFAQVVGRLARTGQTHTVFVHTIHARDTIDGDRAKVVADKRDTLTATLDAIKARQGGER